MLEDINDYFKQQKLASFRFSQLESFIYEQSIIDFDQITVFNKELRKELKDKFKISSLTLKDQYVSQDCIKFLLETLDANIIEVVLLKHKDNRNTLCVSTQIFCPLKCKFCATGAQKFQRNLNENEIISQILIVNNILKNENEKITNIVFMGMGEPFLNYQNLIKSLKIINEKIKIGARHITVSTAGIVPRIIDFADLMTQITLAISLHAPNDELRSELMPINDKYNLCELFKSIDYYIEKTKRRVSFEYVLIKDVNDSVKCANQLSSLLKNRLSHVNLLIYNPHPFADFKKPSIEKVTQFKEILESNNINVSIRKSLGDELSGACGQLAGSKK